MNDEARAGSKVDTVRAMFTSYLQQDHERAERLLADVFVFTSPQDRTCCMWWLPTMTMCSSCTNTS